MKTHKLDALAPIKAFYVASEMLPVISKEADGNLKKIKEGLEKAIQEVDAMNHKDLLRYHLDNCHTRYDNYINSTWELKEISLEDCGVWPRMGGLPYEFTTGNVSDTAKKIELILKDKDTLSWKTARVLYIEEMMNIAELITEYLPIIVLEDGVIRNNKIRKNDSPVNLQCMYDIDDGNHRAVALTLLGKKKVKALIGKRVYKSDLLYS